MRTVIIDDETEGAKMLAGMINKYCNGLELAGMAHSVEDGYKLINSVKPSLIFLDIEMPDGSGFRLLERFSNPDFHVIFTTAYDHYAIKAVRYSAADYLLKPIDIDELTEAVERLQKKIVYRRQHESSIPVNEMLSLSVRDGVVYININTILRIEGDGSYCTFHLTNSRKYMVSKNLKEYEQVLPAGMFFRCHTSHIVQRSYVRKFTRSNDGYFAEMEDGSIVEVSRRKKEEFLEWMNNGRDRI